MRRGFRLAGFPPGCREQGPGFLPARESRSLARARTRKQSRACEERGEKRRGARLARRRRGWQGKCPKSQGAELSFSSISVRGGNVRPHVFLNLWKFGAGFCPASSLPAAGNRGRDFCLFGKTEAVRGPAPGTNRVRARLGKATNTVRELLGAAAGFLSARENRSRARARTRN